MPQSNLLLKQKLILFKYSFTGYHLAKVNLRLRNGDKVLNPSVCLANVVNATMEEINKMRSLQMKLELCCRENTKIQRSFEKLTQKLELFQRCQWRGAFLASFVPYECFCSDIV